MQAIHSCPVCSPGAENLTEIRKVLQDRQVFWLSFPLMRVAEWISDQVEGKWLFIIINNSVLIPDDCFPSAPNTPDDQALHVLSVLQSIFHNNALGDSVHMTEMKIRCKGEAYGRSGSSVRSCIQK